MQIAKFIMYLALILGASALRAQEPELTPIEQLGKHLFFDQNLSTPPGQPCVACHSPETGFTGPASELNSSSVVYPGAVHARFGNRKPPSAAYAGDSPILYFDESENLWIGGLFWDGRATGWTLGDPLAEQALGPFLNNLEQNMPSARQVIDRVGKSNYASLFEAVWGPGSLDNKNVDATYERIGLSIAAYERSKEVSSFTSKYDYYLKGETELTAEETLGLELFEGKAMCSACHTTEIKNGNPPLFTDFTYDNLGFPKNPDNPFYSAPKNVNPAGTAWIDKGLSGFLKAAGYAEEVWTPELGKHKVPTLRNVDKRPYPEFVKAYGHNGYFKSLEDIVHFYNTRDVESWPTAEVPSTVNKDELGNLGLTPAEEAAIVAFMKTLTDGFVLPTSP
ncbi:MAG: cytochrome-c peroxidase [Gammaproteobacteria bacterium]